MSVFGMAVTKDFGGVPRNVFYDYLRELRDSGKIDMTKSIPNLVDRFAVDYSVAREMLYDWMQNYEGD